MPKTLLIIAQTGFQDKELFDTKKILEENNVECTLSSITTDMAQGKLGGTITPDIALKDVDVKNYDAVIVIGGPGALDLINYVEFNTAIKNSVSVNKITAAICIAPVLLAKNGLLNGKKATVWNGDGQQSHVLEENGATFVDKNVVIDGKIITANGPIAAKDFGKAIARAL